MTMREVASIPLPTPIEWSLVSGKAERHIEKLDTLLAEGTVNQHNYLQSIQLVILQSSVQERSRVAKYWEAYVNVHGVDNLKAFFLEWVTSTPTPTNAEFYVKRWDALVNTHPGLELIDDNDFKAWFTAFVNFHGDWINSTSSTDTLSEWMNFTANVPHPFHIEEYEVPEGGFQSFHQLFLRKLKEGTRPLSSAPIVSPCEGGVFYLNKESTADGRYVLPGKSGDEFNLIEALPRYGHEFVGGPMLDVLLWFTDYHYIHAPVTGNVISQGMYRGTYNYNFDDYNPDDPFGPLPPEGSIQVGWYRNLGKHQRYVWIIDTKNPKIGLVAMIAIGFWDVGSIINAVLPEGTNKNPTPIKKGQYMGHFGFGGSSIVLAFQPGKTISFGQDSGSEVIQGPDHPVQLKVKGFLGTISE